MSRSTIGTAGIAAVFLAVTFGTPDTVLAQEEVEEIIVTGIGSRASQRSNVDADKKAIIMRVRRKASPAQIAELRKSLTDWCELVEQDYDCADGDAEEFAALIAFYPVH